MKRKGYTLIEMMVSILIISAAVVVSIRFTSAYGKNAKIRDTQLVTLAENIDIVEDARSKIHTLDDLFAFCTANPEVELYRVGYGRCTLVKSGAVVSVSQADMSESGFAGAEYISGKNLFRIVIPENDIHTRLEMIVYAED